ncbi:MAG: GspE/PulE family protein [Bdellovibrionales bacterium]
MKEDGKDMEEVAFDAAELMIDETMEMNSAIDAEIVSEPVSESEPVAEPVDSDGAEFFGSFDVIDELDDENAASDVKESIVDSSDDDIVIGQDTIDISPSDPSNQSGENSEFGDMNPSSMGEAPNASADASVPAMLDPSQQSTDHSNNTDIATRSASGGGAIKTYVKPEGAPGFNDSDRKTMRVQGRIGDRMVKEGIITEGQLKVGLKEKDITGKMLGEALVDLGFIDEDQLIEVLAKASGYDVFDPRRTVFNSDALELIDKKIAMHHKMLPVALTEIEARIAMADPFDVLALDKIKQQVPGYLKVVPLVCPSSILSDAIDVAYGCASSIDEILGELDSGEASAADDLASLEDDDAFAHPIVRLVNALVFEAVKLGASDLHFEPEENFVRLRYRKDGVLSTAQIVHKEHWTGISQRIKIMSKMNIANKLIPQDGRFGMSVNGREADFRVSSLPTVHGENIVLRVLDQSSSIMPMEQLGFSEHNLKLIKASQASPEGIIIVTGPTGSGKTTSLYSMLNEINTVDVNIQTLEDPVEYSLPMIRQTHVREGVLEFADGIKALLRQDPDIIFIGEIRDGETAGMALKAAMTGHQVYTTLHTNDSFGAIPRLFDLGLKPGMVAGAIVSIFAQRLARKLCSNCKEAYKADEEECKILGVDKASPPKIYRTKEGGCGMCEGTGYKGRTAVVEILMFDEELDELLARGESKADIKALAVKKGFKSMKDDGIMKVLEGNMSLEALAKVVDVTK